MMMISVCNSSSGTHTHRTFIMTLNWGAFSSYFTHTNNNNNKQPEGSYNRKRKSSCRKRNFYNQRNAALFENNRDKIRSEQKTWNAKFCVQAHKSSLEIRHIESKRRKAGGREGEKVHIHAYRGVVRLNHEWVCLKPEKSENTWNIKCPRTV